MDKAVFRVGALEATDARSFDVFVAGPAALLVAKLHKISDRKGVVGRLQNKDGLDILRILRFAPTASLALTLNRLGRNNRAKTGQYLWSKKYFSHHA